jgi:hypothetical protein
VIVLAENWEWAIDRQPDDVPIGHAIPVPGGFANDFGMKNLEL